MIDYTQIKTSECSGKEHRKAYLDGILACLHEKMDASAAVRDRFMTPDALTQSREVYRKKYYDMLGWPLTEFTHNYEPTFKKDLIEELF